MKYINIVQYNKCYYVFKNNEFVFFISQEKFVNKKIDPVILDDVYRYIANPLEV